MQRFQHDSRPAAQENSITIAYAAAAPSNIHAAITMRFAASRSKPACISAHGKTRWQQSKSLSNAICNQGFHKRKELRTHKHTHSSLKRQLQHRRKKKRQNKRTRNRLTHELPCIAGCNHFPMQYPRSHYNKFCSITCLTRMSRRTWQLNVTPIMQPFLCDLQPQTRRFQNIIYLRTHKRIQSSGTKKHRNEGPAPAAHTSCPSSPAAATLPQKHKVSCSGLLPNPSPMQHSCSHYVAFCSSACTCIQHVTTSLCHHGP